MEKKRLNVAMIGGGFMGKAHSNAWLRVNQFFDTDYEIVLKVIAGNRTPIENFAKRWGYEEVTYDWKTIMERDDIDIVNIGTPTFEHKEMVIAAAKAGKHIICEKPFTLTYDDAKDMVEAVRGTGIVHYLNHNYRRVPAIAYAKQLIDEGRIGTIYHWREVYLQDWITDPNFPLSWQLRKEYAGGGPLFDLTSHAVDLARYLIGEPESITAVNKTFIKQRPLPGTGATAFTSGSDIKTTEMGDVEVDDASFAILEFENGALGSIESSRFAVGRKNYNDFEVYGSKGALKFNLEKMNELEFFDYTDESNEQGYRRILVTEGSHPYLSAWWPPGHIIGYEHTFVNAFYDFLNGIAGEEIVKPDFNDGAQIIRILEAADRSSNEGRKVSIDEIK
jgi:predicted dehydrogenase